MYYEGAEIRLSWRGIHENRGGGGGALETFQKKTKC